VSAAPDPEELVPLPPLHSRDAAPTSPARGPVRVLVVDDDAEMRRYLQLCLERSWGGRAEVTASADGEDALARLAAERFDVLVTDLLLPGPDGFTLCAALEAPGPNHGIPALLVTGEPGAIERAAAFGAGRRDRGLLAKPFNAARLVAAIQRLLEDP